MPILYPNFESPGPSGAETMDHREHLQIINPSPKSQMTASFPLFPLLPTELRLEIWRFSMAHHRLICMHTTRRVQDALTAAQESPYLVKADGTQLHVPLLSVSHEARQAALSFYRVRLPCRFLFDGSEEIEEREETGTLLFNPEHDILHLEFRVGLPSTARLFADVRALDPMSVGLCNLALTAPAVASLSMSWPQNDHQLDAQSRASLTEGLARLKQVFFVCVEQAGRVFLGPRASSIDGYEFHHSRPIMSPIASFDRFARDPRGNIAEDLSRVYGGMPDARQVLYKWQLFLEKYNVQHAPEVVSAYRFLVSTAPDRDRPGRICRRPIIKIANRQTASSWLQREDEGWLEGQEKHRDRIVQTGGKIPIESEEELARAPRPAIGFWLFPMEALGPMPGNSSEDNYPNTWTAKRMIDMRNFWPELCLTHLPD